MYNTMHDDRGHHCPFLNRADARCSKHFSLDDLGHAFEYCFGYYEGCGVYLELLVERRVRRARGNDEFAVDGAVDGLISGSNGGTHPRFVQITVGGRQAEDRVGGRGAHTLAGGVGHRAAHPAVVSHATGL
ncbi:MAG TPA: hypothetical protein VH475_10275 [Tepidisphaeraceae bacterium]